MKTKPAVAILGAFLTLIVLALIGIVAAPAQQLPEERARRVTTDWAGYLVIGREDSFDRIAPGPSPAVDKRVQIGLRSDGVLVWRDADDKRQR